MGIGNVLAENLFKTVGRTTVAAEAAKTVTKEAADAMPKMVGDSFVRTGGAKPAVADLLKDAAKAARESGADPNYVQNAYLAAQNSMGSMALFSIGDRLQVSAKSSDGIKQRLDSLLEDAAKAARESGVDPNYVQNSYLAAQNSVGSMALFSMAK